MNLHVMLFHKYYILITWKNFVEKNVIGNEDPMKERREEFFEKYMDYRNQNGMLASEYIKQYIDCLTEGDKE